MVAVRRKNGVDELHNAVGDFDLHLLWNRLPTRRAIRTVDIHSDCDFDFHCTSVLQQNVAVVLQLWPGGMDLAATHLRQAFETSEGRNGSAIFAK